MVRSSCWLPRRAGVRFRRGALSAYAPTGTHLCECQSCKMAESKVVAGLTALARV